MAKLYVVATPIGNLNDLTPRMRQALEECDLVAAEDTRVTMKLMNRFELHKPMISCHRHNEDAKSGGIVEKMLAEDLTVALTCDAGTPGISDPGHVLVAACWEAGIPVVPVSGPSAVATALSAAGFDAREFAFYGFLPREKGALREKLQAIGETGVPVAVLYESPHRVVKLVSEIEAVWPECRLCVCCDLTKKYELMLRGSCNQVLTALSENPNVKKGEYCLVVEVPPCEKAAAPERTEVTPEMFLLSRMMEGEELDQAGDAALEAGYPRNGVKRAKIAVKRRFDL